MTGWRLAVLAVFGVLVAVGCKGSGAGGAFADGTERGACYGNGTCNSGLTCLSKRCVRPPGADCDAVGQALTSIELGNYAPKDERAARVSALAAICRAQNLTKDEGACILDKHSKDELALCPKPLIVSPLSEDDRKAQTGLPAACSEYLGVLDRYASCPKLPPESQRALRQSIAQMRQQWSKLGADSPMPRGVNDACVQGMASIKQGMASMGCP